jgi:predicted ATPase
LQQIRGERSAQRPYLLQINDQNGQDKKSAETVEITTAVLDFFASMRFQNLNTDLMRLPSLPGQPFGERGENLSAALFTICQNPEQKKTLLSWIEDLTPMEAVDFEFPADQIGRVLLTLVERNGQKISAYSASDGTLRLLAMLAALLDPEPAQLYFFEELENGIHPTRLHLLTQLIENQTAVNPIQVVATTHSPHLLRFLSPQTIENVSLLYRLEDRPDAAIKRIVDIPDARRLIETQGIGRLHESNWFEDALFFMDEEDSPLEQEAAA